MLSKASFAGMSLIVGIASAQLANMPSCALNPALAAISGQTKCQLTQFECICDDKDLMSSLSAAVLKACTNTDDLLTAQSAANSICAPYETSAPSPAAPAAAAVVATTSAGIASNAAATTTQMSSAGTASATATMATGAPYSAGNASTSHTASTGGVNSSRPGATGSSIVTGAAARTHADTGYVAAVIALMGSTMFF